MKVALHHLLPAALLLIAVASAFPISKLTTTSDYRLSPTSVHAHADFTVVASLSSNYRINELGLHRDVQVPPLPHGSETMVLLRFHRRTGNVRWARAFTQFQSQLASASDSHGNTYIVGSLNYQFSNVVVFKLNPDGVTLWSRNFTTKGPHKNKVGYRFIRFVVPNTLVLTGGPGIRIVVMDAGTGRIRRTTKLPRSDKVVHMEAGNNQACLTNIIEEYDPIRQIQIESKAALECTSLSGARKIHTYDLDLVGATTFPRSVRMVMAPVSRGESCAPFYVAFERVFNYDWDATENKPGVRHELVVQKLCSKTLTKMPWDPKSTDKSSAKVIQVPTSRYPGAVILIENIRYLPRSNSIVLEFSSTTNLTGVITKKGDHLIAKGRKYQNVWPLRHWVYFFKGNLLPKAVNVDPVGDPQFAVPKPFTRMNIHDFTITTSGRKVLLMGLLEIVNFKEGGELGSGWPFIYEIEDPYLQKKSKRKCSFNSTL